MTNKDNHLKKGSKEFSFDDMEDFDTHIDLSIPNYSFVLEQVRNLSDYFIEDNTNVYDLGCSTGKFLKSLNRRDGVRYVGIDISKNLLPKKEEYPDIRFECSDLLNYNDYNTASFVVSMFTLQFLPLSSRKRLIQKINNSLIPGGAFISCEKIYSSNAKFQDITNSLYYEKKNEHFSGDAILQKEKDLRKIMKIQSIEQSIKDMEEIGPVDIFWRSFNFVGLIAVRKPYTSGL